MITAIRKKFIVIAMLSLVITLVFIIGAVNLLHYQNTRQRADSLIEVIFENDGSFPEVAPLRDFRNPAFQITAETPFESRFFIIHLDHSGEVATISLDHIAALDEETARGYLDEILRDGRESGFLDQYRYRIYPTDAGATVIVLDTFLQQQSIKSIMQITMATFIACVVIVFALLLVLSRYAIRPFVTNMEKQKQFITNASHELKTPITIISANTDVIELLQGESEWSSSTKKQVVRLNRLVKNLIELAKMDEDDGAIEMEEVPLSNLTEEVAGAFEAVARSQGKTLSTQIAPGITLRGSSDSLYRLIQLLLDNAIKYSLEKSEICLSLGMKGRNAVIRVTNATDDPRIKAHAHVFDRFFRGNRSNNEGVEGYGIGLSIAQAIAQRHNGKIAMESADGRVTFLVWLPL